MKLVLKNSNYVHPITQEIVKNVFVHEGEFSDIPLLNKLKISFWLCQSYKAIHFTEENGELKPFQVNKIKVLDTDTLEFTPNSDSPTYVTKDGKTKDLFVFLKTGGQLDGTEPIEVGYPNYQSIQSYLLKDNIGEALLFNPSLDAMELKLAKLFILQYWKLNGEPLGVQFKFEE
ncbi:hypothetical protein V2605_03940 [Tenacibaculum maritimum]|uniref:hypothetical protein n=1 Tax=Tenacibaculum maritimum TaxID=107401 RepID=UPI00387634B9